MMTDLSLQIPVMRYSQPMVRTQTTNFSYTVGTILMPQSVRLLKFSPTDGFILEDSPDDEIRLDHVILPRLSESQQSILQDVGFLGGYALDPSTNELCFKTQVAVRSVLLTANEWEHYMGSGEDLASDKDPEVIEWLRPALEDYVEQAEAAVERLTALKRGASGAAEPSKLFASKLELLQARWEQILSALTRFLEPETMA